MRALLLLFPLLAGCVVGRTSEGEPLDSDLVARLQPGKTTAREVTELLGPPQQVVELERRSAYQYRYTKNAVSGLILVVVAFFNTDSRSDRIWLFFDEEDRLTHYGATFHAHRARTALPWSDLDDPEKNARRDAKREEKRREREAAAQ